MYLNVLSRRPESNTHSTPLLFVHGANHAAWYWVHFLDYFAAHGYAAYAVDLRGHGGSHGRERLRWTRLTDYAHDVAQVASGLAAPPALVGHSLGGLIVQKYLDFGPARAAVFLASTPTTGAAWLLLRATLQHPTLVLPVLRSSTPSLLRDPAFVRETYFSSACTDEVVQDCCRRMQPESSVAMLGAMAFGRHRPKRQHIPMLFLNGAEDSMITPAAADATARRYGRTAEIVPGVGHHMMLDWGWETVAERMLCWFAQQGI